MQEEVERLLERVKQLEAELSEEKTTRALIERNFIRATSRRFFDIKVQGESDRQTGRQPTSQSASPSANSQSASKSVSRSMGA